MQVKASRPIAAGGGARTDVGDQPCSHPDYTIHAIRVNGRTVGEVRGQTFAKRVQRSKHLFRVGPAWGWDIAALREAERLGAEWADVVDMESNTVYRTPIEQIWKFGFQRNFGYGEQVFLRLVYFIALPVV
jgi:hypothetical protein